MGADLKRLEADLLAQSPNLDPHPARASTRADEAAPAESAAANPPNLSPPLPAIAGVATRAIVGRSSEQAVLDDALAAAAAGQGSIVVLVGEPGIGKSRLAEAAVEAAEPAGFATAWARCPESRATPPFWVITQLREQLAAQLPAVTFASARPR